MSRAGTTIWIAWEALVRKAKDAATRYRVAVLAVSDGVRGERTEWLGEGFSGPRVRRPPVRIRVVRLHPDGRKANTQAAIVIHHLRVAVPHRYSMPSGPNEFAWHPQTGAL
jgi:hypothetical protein